MDNEKQGPEIATEKDCWKPTLDFIYFREIEYDEAPLGLIVRPDFEYLPNELPNGGHRMANRAERNKGRMTLGRVVAVGPGRHLPSGSLRVPQCQPGDVVCFLNSGAPLVPTRIRWEDGEDIFCIGCEFINGVRKELPPWAREVKPEGKSDMKREAPVSEALAEEASRLHALARGTN